MNLNFIKNKNIKTILIQIFFVMLIIIPVNIFAGISIENDLSHLYEAKVEEKYSGIIIIRNSGDQVAKVRIYKKDYSFNSEGKSNYLQPGTLKRSNANWVTIVPQVVTIPANGKVEINYIVKVPISLELIGSYWSMIMVEEIVDSRLTDKNSDDVSVGIFITTRYGIQIVTNIGNTGERKLKFIKTDIEEKDNINYLIVDIENVGQLFLQTGIYAEFYNEDGEFIGKFSGENKKRLYPDTSVRFKININDVPSGKYKLLIVADGGEESLFGSKYTITIK